MEVCLPSRACCGGVGGKFACEVDGNDSSELGVRASPRTASRGPGNAKSLVDVLLVFMAKAAVW